MLPVVYLVRHGETEWSLSGRHTGRTDLPLTARGEEKARGLATMLGGVEFASVWSSPRLRARRTCELASPGRAVVVKESLAEWDYGQYEGLTTAQIQAKQPGWSLFRDGCPGGESPAHIAERADGVIAELRRCEENIAIFSHGHFLRSLAARWIGLPVVEGQRFLLDTGSVSVLSFEHRSADEPAIQLWNATADSPGGQHE